MPWGIAAAAVVGAYGASQQAGAAKDGANAQAAANAAAVAEQRRQYDQTRQDQMPWLQAGGWGLGQQLNFLKGDYSDALKSPDYLARMEWGQKALDRGAAARGGMFSGGHQADTIKFGQDMASQGINDYYGKLAGLSGTGQQTAQNLGSLGQSSASNIGSLLSNTGAARSSAYNAAGQAWGNYANDLGGMINYGMNNNWGRG